MTIVFNIIAAPSQPGAHAHTSDGNVAIDVLLTNMKAALDRLPYKSHLAQATYVHDIALEIKKLKDKGTTPDLIQIIGHGSAGRLELGSYWTSVLDTNRGPAVLDSNPESYGMLLEVIPSSTRVFLLGCNVGAQKPEGYVASGRALLFDLEDMSGANVYAADGLVYPALFNDGFLYSGSLVTSNGKPANPSAIALAARLIDNKMQTGMNPTSNSPPQPAPPILIALTSAPAFGLPSERKVQSPSGIAFSKQYVYAQPQPQGLLAQAELIFEASNYPRVEAICCLRYLRVEIATGGTAYFEASRATPAPDTRIKDALDILRVDAMKAAGRRTQS